jgi:hypothetical protein
MNPEIEEKIDLLLKERKKLLRGMPGLRNSGASCSGARIRIIQIEKEIDELYKSGIQLKK